MTISQRLILSFLAIGGGFSALSLAGLSWLERGVSHLDEFHTPALFLIQDVKTELNAVAEEAFSVISGLEGERAPFELALRNADQKIDRFRLVAKLDDPSEVQELELFEQIIRRRVELESQARGLMTLTAPIDLEDLERFQSLVRALNVDVDTLVAIEKDEVRGAQVAALTSISTARFVLVGLAVSSVVGAFFVGGFLARRLTRPIRELEDAARGLSAGRLEQVSESGPPEIAVLAQAFNRMVSDVSRARSSLEQAVAERTADLESVNEALWRSEQRYQDLYLYAPDMYFSIDAETAKIVEFNARVSAVLGFTGDELMGMEIFDLIDPSSEPRFRKAFDVFRETGQVEVPHLRMLGKAGGAVHVSVNATAVCDDQGRVLRSRAIVRDISSQVESQERLRASNQRYRSLVENAPLCIHEIDRDGRLMSMNAAGLRMVGLESEAQVIGTPYLEAVHDDDRARIEACFRAALAGRSSEFEFFGAGDLDTRAYRSCFIPIRDETGFVSKIMGLSEDVTERYLSERRQKLMIHELDHRVKNNLAAVISLANQTLSTAHSSDEFRTAFCGRVHAMARTHEALARTRWLGVSVADAVNLALDPFLDATDGRVRADGDPFPLAPEVATPLGLTLHELATNAAKHGALATPEGFVTISWRRIEGGRLELTWIESNGPRVERPASTGLGLELIRGLVEHEIGGVVEVDFQPTGLRGRIEIPRAGTRRAPELRTARPVTT